uniref:LysR family transcriptional regulator n=1 Tax=Castellaniella defragrans TaxID=75697 RepID=UPI003342A077
MELRHLRYFKVLAETQNFTRAAERLHIAQPPLSRQIQQLEEELGVALIDRSCRPFALTRAGVFFYEQSVQILSRVQKLTKAAQQLGMDQRRSIGIGFAPSLVYGDLLKVVHLFKGGNPEVEISLSELTSVQQAEALLSGRIDVGFGCIKIESDELVSTLIHEKPMVVALPVGSELAKAESVSMAALARETVILYPGYPRPSFADQVLAHFRVRGLSVANTYETNGLQTAIGLAAAGVGIAIVPYAAQRLARSDVAYRTISDPGVVSVTLMMTRAGDMSQDLIRLCSFVMQAY